MISDKKHNRADESNQPPIILLAEDDLEMRKLLSWSLGREGYKIIECADGTSLMRKLGLLGPGNQVQPHDLIISDIRMPGVTGLQVLESVSEFPDFPPMILITAFPDAESRAQAMRLGAVAMVAKPFDIDELIEKVRETIPPEPAKRQKRSAWPETDERSPFPFDITFRHDSGSEAAKEYIQRVATKLHPFADHIVNGRIIVDQSDRLEHRDHRYTVTLVLSTPGKSIIIKHNPERGAGDENLYIAVNVVFGTAARKLKHYIKKRQEHRKHPIKKIQFEEAEEDDDDDNFRLESDSN